MFLLNSDRDESINNFILSVSFSEKDKNLDSNITSNVYLIKTIMNLESEIPPLMAPE